MTSFHKWLITQRRYCEHRGCIMNLRKATQVVNRNGKDLVMCDFHAYKPQPTKRTKQLCQE